MLQECPKPIISNLTNIVALGTGTSFNVAEILPNTYQNLTEDNFYMKTCTSTSQAGKNLGGAAGESYKFTNVASIVKTYDSSTGTLTFYVSAYGTINVTGGSGGSYSTGRPQAPVEAYCIYN